MADDLSQLSLDELKALKQQKLSEITNASSPLHFANKSIQDQYAQVTDPVKAVSESSPRSISINSAYRDPEHNAAVGGVPNSYHTKGEALDLGMDTSPDVLDHYRANGFKVIPEPAKNHFHTQMKPLSDMSLDELKALRSTVAQYQDRNKPIPLSDTSVATTQNPEDPRNNSLLGIASGMARQLPIPEGLAGGLVRADVVDPVMNAINYFKTGEAKPYSFTQSFKRGAEITPKSITDINKRNPIASTVGGIAAAIPEYAIGAEGVGMGPGTGLGTNLLKGAGLNTLIGQGARGLAFDPKANAIDAAFGAGGELAGAGAQKLLGKLPAKLMNSALSTPAKVLEKGSTLGQDLVDRGVWGTQGSLRRQAADMSSNLEDQLQNVLSSKSGTNVDSQSILDTLENLKQSKSAVFGGSKDAAYVQDVIDEIKQHPAFGNLDAPQANVMKRAVYKGIGSPGYLKDNPSIRLEADKAIGRSLKNSIEDVAPEAGPINKELGIYSQLNKYAQKQSAKDSIKSLFSPFRIGTDLLAAKAAGPLGPMAAELGRTTIGKTGSAQLINQALKNQILRYLGTIGSTGINSQMP